MSFLESPIQYIKGVGPHRARLLGRLNIKTVKDALFYLPFRYEDRRNLKNIRNLSFGDLETVRGEVVSININELPQQKSRGIEGYYRRQKKLTILEVNISDGTGIIKAKWFNQPFMKRKFKKGQEVIISGIIKTWGNIPEIVNPEYELIDEDSELIHTSRIVPVYRVTEGISARILRGIIYNILTSSLDEIIDPLPEEIRRNYNLPALQESLFNCHFPPADSDISVFNRGVSPYHRRLAFDEIFNLEVGIAVIKKDEVREKGISFNPEGRLVRELLGKLDFELTAAQKRVFNEILEDMKRPYPMNRLIQGDVGCGKTIIALMAILTAVESGYQAAMMAPTEILAEQHYINIHRLIEDLGLRICLLSSSLKDKPLQEIAGGEIDIIVGTHAIIQDNIRFKRLGLVVIDEQHRFGVMQRSALRKKGKNPDVLVMTATPIPRTLAMTVYGDLDYSIIDELPPGRRPVITRVFNRNQKQYIYQKIREEVSKGGQAYVIYPVIEESENHDLKSAITGKEALEKMFPEFRIGLVHGRMKSQEREAVMLAFKKKEIDILVSTTVIEVGVDVPNATLMLIIHAERFGLAQLHQLRGRVGRGRDQSYCLLLAYDPLSEEARRRLEVMVRSNNGFVIAEEDLNIRGPGEFFGTRQSGLPDLKIANIVRDADLIEIARREAFKLVEIDPELDRYPVLKDAVSSFWTGKIEIFKTA
jgi:ATP-dependent DNA helicase RecG